ncbi:MAG: glycosyltransferase family 4 protein [Flavobacteriaceae bacterium]|nr:glycosyltransferase family 4 protein [Flavobacteriaceae bacterium]
MDDLPHFVFYEHPNVDSGLDVIADYLPKLSYEVRHTNIRLVGETFFEREWTSFKLRYLSGDAGLGDLSDIDVLLSIDFNLGVPKKNKIKTVLISYDMIPWVLSDHYYPSFKQNFSRTKDVKRSIKAAIERQLYFNKFRQANKRADRILSISEHTKRDIVRILNIDPTKITTVLLGIDHTNNKESNPLITTSDATGDEKKINTSKKKYVFFMGGADRRRKIEELVSAFDSIADREKDMHLVLSGYDFQSYETIPTEIIKQAISRSTHKNRILFAGFIKQSQRNALFTNAIAFVFPSTYEGFGLPILEAMDMGCPVITYHNSSIPEVGDDAVLYAKDAVTIKKEIELLISDEKQRQELIARGKRQLKSFSWKFTAQKTLNILKKYK